MASGSSSVPKLEAALAGLAFIGAMASRAHRHAHERQAGPTQRAAAEAPDHASDDGGRRADTPSRIGWRGWKDILWRIYGGFIGDRLSLVSAGVAFFGLLALFPAIAALVALYGLFADPSSINAQLASLEGVVPDEGLALIRQQITRLAEQGQSSLGLVFFIGLAVSLWSAMSGIKTMFDALNIVYEEDEKRSFLKLNFEALLFTLAALLFVIVALGAIVVVPVVVAWTGISSSFLPALRWPLMYAIVLLALAVLYRYGPSRERPQWRWVTWGSAIAGFVWIIGSILFSWYVASFGSYNKTYGSLGAVVAFMVWLWLSALVILLGAEINAAMERQTERDTTTGPERPRGQRGARVADAASPG